MATIITPLDNGPEDENPVSGENLRRQWQIDVSGIDATQISPRLSDEFVDFTRIAEMKNGVSLFQMDIVDLPMPGGELQFLAVHQQHRFRRQGTESVAQLGLQIL